MGLYVDQLRKAIRDHKLDRYPEVAPLLTLMGTGRLKEWQAKAWLLRLAKLIQQQIDSPNVLHAPPTADQLYADGKPDVEIATLENGLRVGIRLLDRPRHVLCAGSTGSGKTTCIRALVMAIDKLGS